MRLLREAEIERKACEYAEGLGFLPIKVGKNGWPDRLIATPHAGSIWIEFKTQSGRLRALQKARIRQLLKLRHYVAIINTFESAKSLLDSALFSADGGPTRGHSSLCRLVARSGAREDLYCPDDI
jgi:hypothetical protein